MRFRSVYALIAGIALFGSGEVQNPKPISLEAWATETFALPPGFAPEMPKGTESLRFAPGWRKAESEEFWSYAFVMWIDERAPNRERVDALLETYYNGLLTVFAQEQGKDISGTPVRVDVTRKSAGKYEASMQAVDAFATFKLIAVRFEVQTVALGPDRSSLRIKLSPQPKDHAIWKSLDAAISEILKENKALDGMTIEGK